MPQGASNARRRRHSSVGLGQEETSSPTAASDSANRQHGQTRDRRHRLLAGAAAQHPQSLDYGGGGGGGGGYDAVVANVTVAIEPPSPTEKRRQCSGIPPAAPCSSVPSAAAAVSAAGQVVNISTCPPHYVTPKFLNCSFSIFHVFNGRSARHAVGL